MPNLSESIGPPRRLPVRRDPAGVAAALGVVTVLALVHAGGNDAAARLDGTRAAAFRLVATHPSAARQPSVRGKTIGVLEPWAGRLYAGYGDYGDNTGPIAISPYDPATGTFEELWISDTEAIENYRPIRGRLYAPAIDRKSRADYAVGEPWSDVGTLNTTHAYDIVTLDGTDLWLVGSQGVNATAWRSTDEGATWKRSLQVPEAHGLRNDFARFYFAGVFAGKLYVQASDFYGGAHAASEVFDGASWSDGPDLLPTGGMGWRPVPFAGRLVYRSLEQGGSLVSFDGEAARYVVGWQALDAVLADGFLTVLRTEREPATGRFGAPAVARTADLETWEVLDAPAPEGTRSLAWLGAVPYLGGTDARLFALEGEATWKPTEVVWNRPPAISIVTPADGARFVAPATIPILAEASDPEGGLGRVMFWAGSTRLGEDTTPPYSLTWRDVVSGTYRLDVRAVDDASAYEDAFATITVSPGSNGPPVIEGPIGQQPDPGSAGEPVTLTVTASDPDGDPLTIWWDLGDGERGTGAEVAHVYPALGSYPVSVVVSDGRGGVAEASGTVVVVRDAAAAFVPFAGQRLPATERRR